jgi:hypothetical protein
MAIGALAKWDTRSMDEATWSCTFIQFSIDDVEHRRYFLVVIDADGSALKDDPGTVAALAVLVGRSATSMMVVPRPSATSMRIVVFPTERGPRAALQENCS